MKRAILLLYTFAISLLMSCEKNSEFSPIDGSITVVDANYYSRFEFPSQSVSSGDFVKLIYERPETPFVNASDQIVYDIHDENSYTNTVPANFYANPIFFFDYLDNHYNYFGNLTLYGPYDAHFNPGAYHIQEIEIINNNLYQSVFDTTNWTEITNYTFVPKSISGSSYNEYTFSISTIRHAYIITKEL